MITLELTKEQKKHLKSIKWLFSEGHRQEGRTLLLAYVYILEAINGRQIEIVDHAYITTGAGYRANKMLADVIQRMILDNELPLEIKQATLTLRRK